LFCENNNAGWVLIFFTFYHILYQDYLKASKDIIYYYSRLLTYGA